MKLSKENLFMLGIISALIATMYHNIIKGQDRNFDLISQLSDRISQVE